MSNVDLPPRVPPMEVVAEFLFGLATTVTRYDRIVPVLRGSVLMKHWFGEAARPAGDIDLEWFATEDRDNRQQPVVEHAKRLCLFAVQYSDEDTVQFDENADIPADGTNLWSYDTPGVRCFTGWTWEDRDFNGLLSRQRGLLQIDIAQAGTYHLDDIVAEDVQIPRAYGEPVSFLAYAPEMLLAAKFSWIVRHLKPVTLPDSASRLDFDGEPKDLFDAHLLLTSGRIRPEFFQTAFLAVAMEDKLDWKSLTAILDSELEIPDDTWAMRWPEFFAAHQELLSVSPGEMLRTVMMLIRTHLGALRDHVPFLESVAADPVDEVAYLIYADWLEDHSDPRSEFVRRFCRYHFHDDMSELEVLWNEFSLRHGAWLSYLFGNPARVRDIRRRMESRRQKPPATESPTSESVPDSRPNSGASASKPWWKFW